MMMTSQDPPRSRVHDLGRMSRGELLTVYMCRLFNEPIGDACKAISVPRAQRPRPRNRHGKKKKTGMDRRHLITWILGMMEDE